LQKNTTTTPETEKNRKYEDIITVYAVAAAVFCFSFIDFLEFVAG
jgi:hypothetical protein